MNENGTTGSKVWRIPRFSDLELLRGTQLTHSFPRHTHERYAIGVIEQGALGFYYRGENVVAAPGNINLCIPGEVHTGQPATDGGWTYRMFYFDAAVLQNAASAFAGRPRDVPFFKTGVIDDRVLAGQLRTLHRQFEEANSSLLAQETTLMELLAQLIIRHSDDPPQMRRSGQEPTAVSQIKQYIENHYAQDISLETLARLAHLSRYHLVRVFREATGIPPHAYLRQVRIKQAKARLAAGQAIADVALATGFTDQSHLTRWFKKLWGFTPGQYRNSVQDT